MQHRHTQKNSLSHVSSSVFPASQSIAAPGSSVRQAVTPLFGGQCVELIENRFYLAFLNRPPTQADVATLGPQASAFYAFDAEYIYERFDHDFGPYHLGYTVAYCRTLARRFADPAMASHRIYHWVQSTPANRANAAVLAASYLVLCQDMAPEDAVRLFAAIAPPFPPFRDALPGPATFNLSLLDVLRGLARAKASGIFSVDNFDLDSYMFYSRVEHGDMCWVLPRAPVRGAPPGGAGGAPVRGAGAILAFSGPVHPPTPDAPFTPNDYIPYFKKHNVGLVIRLNQAAYPATHFEKHGIRHLHLFFPDGSVPPRDRLLAFMRAAEAAARGGYAIAVHCRAGLGRTGSLICAWMMYKLGFSAAESLGYIRVARPGSVLGPQQQWLYAVERSLHALAAQKRIERDVDQMGSAGLSGTAAPAPATPVQAHSAEFSPQGARRAPPTLAQAGQRGFRASPNTGW